MSKPTIYRRWPGGKPEIVAEAIRAKRAEFGELPDTGTLRGDLMAMLGGVIDSLDAQLAGGLLSQLRASDELTDLFRNEVVADERAPLRSCCSSAPQARGEIRRDVTPLFSDIAGSVIFTRSLIAGEPLDHEFLTELVDHVLLPLCQEGSPQWR